MQFVERTKPNRKSGGYGAPMVPLVGENPQVRFLHTFFGTVSVFCKPTPHFVRGYFRQERISRDVP
jgi:hypothetical protein